MISSVSFSKTDTTYPREGTETMHDARKASKWRRHNLSPRGDGNAHITASERSKWDTTYPREGTETFDCHTLRAWIPRHNLSPRGDGNKRIRVHDLRHSQTQLIPARGRKPAGTCGALRARLDTTYPREGTETIADHLLSAVHYDTTYPREGTETGRISWTTSAVTTQLIPARGRKQVLRHKK